MKIEEYRNILALLQMGKFTLTVQESEVLLILIRRISEEIRNLEKTPKEENKSE